VKDKFRVEMKVDLGPFETVKPKEEWFDPR
jgi:hypothetical protein